MEARSDGTGRSGFRREGSGLEFDRAVFFSDAIFAIAVTLIVVTIEFPSTDNAGVGRALGEIDGQIVSFFVTFAVIGYCWYQHHGFVAGLARIGPPLMVLNLMYLAAIAFMPLPTDVLGEHAGSPVAVAFYAVTIATVSLLALAMIVCAHVTGALVTPLSSRQFRHAVAGSLVPVIVFLASIPLAIVNTTAALLSWLLIIPAAAAVNRLEPGDDLP